MSRNSWKITVAVGLATVLASGSASAQSVTTEQIDKLQAQIQALQRELQSMKKKADTANKAYAASTG
jgi:prefoldin subunit 5